jgi:hypothetical protein
MTTFSLPTSAHLILRSQAPNSGALLFNEARATARRRGSWVGLVRRQKTLRTLKQAQPYAIASHAAGLLQVKLDDIRGTEGRRGGFDDKFYPLSDLTRRRWESVADMLEAGRALPPVQLIKVGGEYFVRDGHHRISVTRALGQDTIEAEVTVWTTKKPGPTEEAKEPTWVSPNTKIDLTAN